MSKSTENALTMSGDYSDDNVHRCCVRCTAGWSSVIGLQCVDVMSPWQRPVSSSSAAAAGTRHHFADVVAACCSQTLCGVLRWVMPRSTLVINTSVGLAAISSLVYCFILTLSIAAQCIIIGPVCGGRTGGQAIFMAGGRVMSVVKSSGFDGIC